VYRYQHTYRYQRSRIHQPHVMTLLLAMIIATVAMIIAAFTLTFLLTGWPLR
jgi:hypothetical protein